MSYRLRFGDNKITVPSKQEMDDLKSFVFEHKELWSGSLWPDSSQTINLSENISSQKNGVILVFSEYSNSTPKNYGWHYFFVPKYHVVNSLSFAQGTMFLLSTSNLGIFGAKYIYIHDNKLVGNDNNKATGTGTSGITYSNNRWCIRYVIGV